MVDGEEPTVGSILLKAHDWPQGPPTHSVSRHWLGAALSSQSLRCENLPVQGSSGLVISAAQPAARRGAQLLASGPLPVKRQESACFTGRALSRSSTESLSL